MTAKTQIELRTRADDIRAQIAHATGTKMYYRYNCGGELLATDGAMAMADLCGAYWLLDVICSHQYGRVMREPFQVWKLELCKTTNGAFVRAEDGNGRKLATQRIPFTDFPLPEGIMLYVENGVMFLPSER
jgi:hypothetical protein